MEDQLDPELLALETQLASLVPSALPSTVIELVHDEVNLSMIDAATDVHDAELKDLEEHLGILSPAGLPTDVLARMSQAMDRWHEHVPVEEKVVPFGKSKKPDHLQEEIRSAKTSSSSSMYAAAAAVALLGAATAIFFPVWNNKETPMLTSGERDLVTGPDITASAIPLGNKVDISTELPNAWLVPDSLSHNVTHTTDAGVLMTRDNIPHRSIRIDYVDRIKVLAEDGREIEINRPGVQYMLIPVQTN